MVHAEAHELVGGGTLGNGPPDVAKSWGVPRNPVGGGPHWLAQGQF